MDKYHDIDSSLVMLPFVIHSTKHTSAINRNMK